MSLGQIFFPTEVIFFGKHFKGALKLSAPFLVLDDLSFNYRASGISFANSYGQSH